MLVLSTAKIECWNVQNDYQPAAMVWKDKYNVENDALRLEDRLGRKGKKD